MSTNPMQGIEIVLIDKTPKDEQAPAAPSAAPQAAPIAPMPSPATAPTQAPRTAPVQQGPSPIVPTVAETMRPKREQADSPVLFPNLTPTTAPASPRVAPAPPAAAPSTVVPRPPTVSESVGKASPTPSASVATAKAAAKAGDVASDAAKTVSLATRAAQIGEVASTAGSAVGGSVAQATASIGGVVSTVSKLGAAAGPAGAALAAVAVTAGGLVAATKRYTDEMTKQVQAVRGLSPDVAAASAESAMRRLGATARRAQQIGPELARFERGRGQIEEALMDLKTEVLRAGTGLYGQVGPDLEKVAGILNRIAEGIEHGFKLAEEHKREMAAIKFLLQSSAPLKNIVDLLAKILGVMEKSSTRPFTADLLAPLEEYGNPMTGAPGRGFIPPATTP